MNILALDLGTRFGFAILFNGTFLSGTKQLSKAFGRRFAEFQKWLKDTIYKYRIEEVCFDRVRRHIGTDAAHVYGGFMCMLSAVCHELGLLCRGFEVSVIKKNMTGNGRATKSMVVKAAQLLGFDPDDDNEADAIAVLLCRLKSPSKNRTRHCR